MRNDIQILRGISVLSVIGYHFFPETFQFGYLGVDLFFLISGFVVTPKIAQIFKNQKNTKKHLFHFYRSRFLRLIPSLAVVNIVSIPLILLLGNFSDFSNFLSQSISSQLFLANIGALFFSGGYFNPNPNPFIHTWSLSVEEQIYLTFPLFILFILNNRKSTRFFVYSTLFVTSSLAYFIPRWPFELFALLNPNAKRLLETAIPETVGFYSTFGRIWEFMIGAFLSHLLIHLKFKNIKMTTRFDIFVVIILTVLFLEPIKILFVARVILIFMLAVIYILFKIDFKHDYFPLRQLKAIGDRSYSWYLVHMPIAYLVNSSPILQNSSKLNSILKIFGLIFLVLLGNVLFTRVESKFRIRSSENLITEQNFKFKFVIFFIIPLLLTITAKITFNIVYEIQIVSKKPSYAGDLIHDLCNPQSLITDYPCEFKIKTNANPAETNSNSIVLVGDSHALQYTVAFNSIVNKLNLKAYYYGDLYENNNFEEFVAANNIDIIVISKFWNLGTYHDLLKGLSKIKNVEIIVVGQNPVFPDGKKFMVFNSFFQNQYEAPLDAKISELESEPLKAGQAVKYLSIGLGFEYIDIQSIFCSNGICTRFDKNNWFWIDRDHLSITGANKVKPTFEYVLRSYIG